MKSRSRTPSPRVLRYRPAVVVVSALMFCSGAVLLGESLAHVVAHPSDFNDDLVFRIIGVSLSAYFLFTVFLPLMFACIQVFTDRVEERRGGKTRTLAFKNIAAVETPPAWSRWFWIRTKEGKYLRFSMFLERPEYLLDALMSYNPKLMAPHAYTQLRLRLFRKDHASARISDRFRGCHRKYTLLTATVYAAFLGVLLAHVHNNINTMSPPGAFATKLHVGLFIAFMMILEAAIQFATEKRIESSWLRRFRKNPAFKSRDLAYERRCYRTGLTATMALFTVVTVAYMSTDFLFLKMIRAANEAPGLGISKGNTFTLDYRSTCTQCAERLKTGDLVTFVDEERHYRMGRIEILSTRSPASDVSLIEDVVTVRTNPDGASRVTIPRTQVVGSMR